LELTVKAAVFGAGFDAVAPLVAFGAVLLAAAALVAPGIVFSVVAPLALVFAAGQAASSILLFTVVLPGLAMTFVAVDGVFMAGFVVCATIWGPVRSSAWRLSCLASGQWPLPLFCRRSWFRYSLWRIL